MVSRSNFNGILPIPKSPGIKNGDPRSYIKHSHYPIPYQAVIAIESCDINNVLSWDINVSTKNIKIKIEWSLAQDVVNGYKDPFPKAINSSISSYLLHQPSWSTSCSDNKLLLKVDWKIMDNNNNTQSPVFPSPSQLNSPPVFHPTPTNRSSFFTPRVNPYPSNGGDSGYGSYSRVNSHQHLPRFPGTRLDFSPVKSGGQHDVYKANSNKSPSVNSNKAPPVPNDPLSKSQVPPPKPNIPTTMHDNPPVIPSSTIDPNSSTTHPHKPDLPAIPASTDPYPKTSNPSLSSPNLPDLNPTDSLPITSEPIKSPKSHTLPDISSGPSKSRKKENKVSLETSCPNAISKEITNVPHNDTNPVSILSSPNILVVSECSKDGNIRSEIDPTVPEFDPQNDSFAAHPDPLPTDSFGRLDPNIRADRMNIRGKCRLCNKEIQSFQTELHLLDCRGIQQIDTDDFAHEYADITNDDYANIITIMIDYCECVMHDVDVSRTFSKVSTLRQFLYDFESLLDRKAIKIYNKIGMHGQQKRFNILDYSP